MELEVDSAKRAHREIDGEQKRERERKHHTQEIFSHN
jgi:hypothetical protein